MRSTHHSRHERPATHRARDCPERTLAPAPPPFHPPPRRPPPSGDDCIGDVRRPTLHRVDGAEAPAYLQDQEDAQGDARREQETGGEIEEAAATSSPPPPTTTGAALRCRSSWMVMQLDDSDEDDL